MEEGQIKPAAVKLPPEARRALSMRLLEWVVPALVLAPTILLPLTRDQGTFAYGGRVILDGGLPYRDFVDQKGPATHYTFALVIAFLGENAEAIRLFFLGVMVVGARLAAAVAGRLGGNDSRLPAALAYALICLQGPRDAAWMTAQVEDILLPLFLAVVVLLDSPEALVSRCRLFVAGLALGLCCLYKPTAFLTVAGIAGVVAWGLRGSSSERVSRWVCASAGFLLLPAVSFAYLAPQPGWLPKFWAVQEFNANYGRLYDGSLSQAIEIFTDRWVQMLPLVLGGILAIRRPASVAAVTFFAVLITSATMLLVQWKFGIIYQWTPLVGCLAILAGIGLGRVQRKLLELLECVFRRGPHGSTCLSAALTGVAMVGLAVLLVPVRPAFALDMWRGGLKVAAGRSTADAFRCPFPCGTWNARELEEAVAYVREHTYADDPVLVWGYEPAINFLSGRRSPSRFFVERWLTIPGVPRQAAWRKEFMEDLKSRPPRYVLVVDDNNRPWYIPNPVDALQGFPEFAEFLQDFYEVETTRVRITFYRRRSATESAGDPSGRLSGTGEGP